MRRTLFILAWAAPAWALIALATGGLGWAVGPIRLSFRQPLRPALVGVTAAIIYLWRFPQEEREADDAWLRHLIQRSAFVAAVLAVVAALTAGVYFGSFAVGGSDSYGYVSQAQLWLHGRLHVPQPWVTEMSWPQRDWSFAPLGYRPSSPDGTIVPTYAPGLPILMAAFAAVAGPVGPFLVVPILGALAVGITYLLGVEVTGSRTVGATAAVLLVASPVFLAHLMLPMTDVPMAAGWTLVMWLALRRAAFAAGLVAAAMLLMRPNLLLLACAPIAAWLWPVLQRKTSWREAARLVVRFTLAVSPAVVAIAAVNAWLYGSPLQSGYGGLSDDMYELGRAPQNLRVYLRWLVQSQTILVGLAAVPFVFPGALRDSPHVSVRAGLTALVGLTLISYLFYYVFDVWFYLRYLLPALPVLFVLMAAGIRAVSSRLPSPARTAAAILLVCGSVPFSLRFAQDQRIFNQYEFEQRYAKAAHYVERLTPKRAVILAVQHSGSIRYYADRITLRYDYLPADGLDGAIAELNSKGYRPYIVVDDWEETEFRNRFAKSSRVGRLDWRPLVRVLTNPEVRIYDPEGRVDPAAPVPVQ